MNKATFSHQVIEYKDGKPLRDNNGRLEFSIEEKEHTLPNGWEFLELDEIKQSQVEKFELALAKELGKHKRVEVKDQPLTRLLFSGAVVRAAVEAGLFGEHPDIKDANPKDLRRAAFFIDAYKTDLDIIPENLS